MMITIRVRKKYETACFETGAIQYILHPRVSFPHLNYLYCIPQKHREDTLEDQKCSFFRRRLWRRCSSRPLAGSRRRSTVETATAVLFCISIYMMHNTYCAVWMEYTFGLLVQIHARQQCCLLQCYTVLQSEPQQNHGASIKRCSQDICIFHF